MPSHRERSWPGIAVAYTVLLAVLGAVTSLAYDAAAPAYRSQVIRLSVLLAIGVALFHILSRWRGSLEGEPPSRFEAALTRQSIPPKADIAFLRSRDAVASAIRSQSGFEHLVSARLSVLSGTLGDSAEPARPAYRRWLGLGPSRRAVAALISEVEQARAERR